MWAFDGEGPGAGAPRLVAASSPCVAGVSVSQAISPGGGRFVALAADDLNLLTLYDLGGGSASCGPLPIMALFPLPEKPSVLAWSPLLKRLVVGLVSGRICGLQVSSTASAEERIRLRRNVRDRGGDITVAAGLTDAPCSLSYDPASLEHLAGSE